jgi:hypothetical protein
MHLSPPKLLVHTFGWSLIRPNVSNTHFDALQSAHMAQTHISRLFNTSKWLKFRCGCSSVRPHGSNTHSDALLCVVAELLHYSPIHGLLTAHSRLHLCVVNSLSYFRQKCHQIIVKVSSKYRQSVVKVSDVNDEWGEWCECMSDVSASVKCMHEWSECVSEVGVGM